MLYSIYPFSFVKTAIEPVHLSISTAHVSFIIALVEVATLPCELSVSPLFIVLVVSFIFIAVSCSFFPESLAFSKAVQEKAFEVAFICPIVSALTRRHAIGIVTSVHIQVRKFFNPNPMF